MCGIVGRAGLLGTDDERVFKTLLLLDYFRGQDSTGVCVVSKKGLVDVLKVADDPIMLFQQSAFDATVVGVSDAIWIGHNRAATIGVTTRANAHPFKCDHITGVHNGTLEKSSLAVLASRLDDDYGTDSETVFQHMARYGVEETVSRMQGAWALVWYNAKDETLNMLRNDKRPLFLCKTDKGDKAFLTWASEFKMIVAARAMADVIDGKLRTDEEGYGYFPLPTDSMHTWTKAQLLEGELDPVIKDVYGMAHATVYKPVTTNWSATTNANSASSCSASGPTEVIKPEKTSTFPLVVDTYEVMDVDVVVGEDELVLGVMEKDEWEEISRFGCSCCGADVDPEEDGLVVYVNEGVVVCPKCSDETTTVVTNSFGIKLTDRIIG